MRDHQAALLRHARTVVQDDDLALDAVQATMLLIARRLRTLRDPRWFRAWAFRIATREAVRIASRCGRERRLFDDGVGVATIDAAMPESHAPDDLVRACLAAVGRLPPASQSVALLHYREGLTLIEIAEALALPLGTVKSRLAYALERTRAMVARGLSETPPAR